MLQYFSIALFLWTKNRSYGKLLVLANEIHDGLDNMSSVYTNPVPDLPTFATQISDLYAAIIKYGDRAGSKNDLVDLKAKAKIVRLSVRALADYAMTTTVNDPDSWALANFPIKSSATPIGSLQAVQKFRSIVSAKVPLDSLRLRWSKPEDSERAKNIKYKVMSAATSDFTTAELIGIVSKTFYQSVPATSAALWYWVIPINSDGSDGDRSSALQASPRTV